MLLELLHIIIIFIFLSCWAAFKKLGEDTNLLDRAWVIKLERA